MSDFAMLAGNDHWLRVAHENTSVDFAQQTVQLAWQYPESRQTSKPITEFIGLAGLAFDPWCRAYHSVPTQHTIERLRWDDRLSPQDAIALLVSQPQSVGDFVSTTPVHNVNHPQGLAIDGKGRLFIADSGNRRILVFDIMDKRLIRSINLSATPTALCCDGESVWALLVNSAESYSATHIVQFDAVSALRDVPIKLPEGINTPYLHDITVDSDGRLFVLHQAHSADASVWAIDGLNQPIAVAFASAIISVAQNELVVARQPSDDFIRFSVTPTQIAELPQLQARHYDGRGIAIDPFGRVAYWSSYGVMNATQARIKYVSRGRIIGFRLDNQAIQRRWGRVFIDACLPHGTQLTIGFIVSDESTLPQPVAATPAQNVDEYEILRPDLTPPLPGKVAMDGVQVSQTLHRRSQNRELPWSFTDEPWRTYEAPVTAAAGRYLWLVVDLIGKSHVTPKIKNIRVEYPAIDMLRRLPRVFSEQGQASEFLHRYLNLLNCDFDELSKRADLREIMLDPYATPEALLPWLGSLVGMELDQRWSVSSKRQILHEAVWLFKYRGTLSGIKRFIEIYLQREITIIEHFKVRGLGGAYVGTSDTQATSSILGAGFRIGGKLGSEDEVWLDEKGEQRAFVDAIMQHAHRFSVIVPLMLSDEQRSVIQHILEQHRPAHTVFDICSVDSGMRIGTGLHLGMTSVVGKSSGFGQLQLGKSVLGRTDLLGRASTGMTVGVSNTGIDTRVG